MLSTVTSRKKFHRFNKPKRAVITACIPKPNYKVWVEFNSGLSGEIDLSHLIGKGVFKAWQDIEFFNAVTIDPITFTLSWGKDIEIDPYVIQESIMQT